MPYSTDALVQTHLAFQLGNHCLVVGSINKPLSQLQCLGHVKNSLMPEFVPLSQCANPNQFAVEKATSADFFNWATLLPVRVFRDGKLKAGFQFLDRSKYMFSVDASSASPAAVSGYFSSEPACKSMANRLVELLNDTEVLQAWSRIGQGQQERVQPIAPAPVAAQAVVAPTVVAPAVAAPVKSKDLFEGRFDTIIEGRAEGWVFNHAKPGQRYEIDLYAENRLVAWGKADLYREDLFAAKKGDGRLKFSIPLPRRVLVGQPRKITARIHGTSTVVGFNEFKPTEFEPHSTRPLLISEQQFEKVQEDLSQAGKHSLLVELERIQVSFENGDTLLAKKLLEQQRPYLLADAPEYFHIFEAQLLVLESKLDSATQHINEMAHQNPFSWVLWEAKIALEQMATNTFEKSASSTNTASESFKDILWHISKMNACLDFLERGNHGR